MYLAKRLDQYNGDCIYFCESTKNNIMNDSYFIRILYSNSFITISGVYLILNINGLICDKYYNKYKCTFNPSEHIELINSIKEIEIKILSKANIKNKNPQYKIYDLLKNGFIKIFNEIPLNDKNSFVLKISGIWETQYSYGLTYKFIAV